MLLVRLIIIITRGTAGAVERPSLLNLKQRRPEVDSDVIFCQVIEHAYVYIVTNFSVST